MKNLDITEEMGSRIGLLWQGGKQEWEIARDLHLEVVDLMVWIQAHESLCPPRRAIGRRRGLIRKIENPPQLYLNSDLLRSLIVERLRVKPPLSFTEIAKEFSCSRQRISQIVVALGDHPAIAEYQEALRQADESEERKRAELERANREMAKRKKLEYIQKLTAEMRPINQMWSKKLTIQELAYRSGITYAKLIAKITKSRKVLGNEWFPRRKSSAKTII